MQIEKVTIEDAKELLDIYAPYVEKTAITFEVKVPSTEEFIERIKRISDKYPYLKAVDQGQIVGYAYAGAFKERAAYDWAVESTVYVKESFRHKGVGRELYDALEKALRQMGILNMNACIASPASNSEYLNNDSQYFHEKMGFELVGRFHNCGSKFGKWFDMIWMEKHIGEHCDSPSSVSFGNWTITR